MVFNISLIKKYRRSFYLAFFNFSPFKKELSARIDKSFTQENIKGNKYLMYNIVTQKSEGIIDGKDELNLSFEGYEYKIIRHYKKKLVI